MHLLIYLQPFIEKAQVNLGMPLKSILEIITIIIMKSTIRKFKELINLY
jgi:hypothetical protein